MTMKLSTYKEGNETQNRETRSSDVVNYYSKKKIHMSIVKVYNLSAILNTSKKADKYMN